MSSLGFAYWAAVQIINAKDLTAEEAHSQLYKVCLHFNWFPWDWPTLNGNWATDVSIADLVDLS